MYASAVAPRYVEASPSVASNLNWRQVILAFGVLLPLYQLSYAGQKRGAWI